MKRLLFLFSFVCFSTVAPASRSASVKKVAASSLTQQKWWRWEKPAEKDPTNSTQVIGATLSGLTIADAAVQAGLDFTQLKAMASGKYHTGLNNQVFNSIWPFYQFFLRIATPVMVMSRQGKKCSAPMITALVICILLAGLDAGYHVATIPTMSLPVNGERKSITKQQGEASLNSSVAASPGKAKKFAWQQGSCITARGLARLWRGILETNGWRQGMSAFATDTGGTKTLYGVAFLSMLESLIGTFGVRFPQQHFVKQMTKAGARHQQITELVQEN